MDTDMDKDTDKEKDTDKGTELDKDVHGHGIGILLLNIHTAL
jgi:hypothetical protein